MPSHKRSCQTPRKKNDKHYKGEHSNAENKKVLWPKDKAEDDEFSFQDFSISRGSPFTLIKGSVKKTTR
jgi:hypothetical protein